MEIETDHSEFLLIKRSSIKICQKRFRHDWAQNRLPVLPTFHFLIASNSAEQLLENLLMDFKFRSCRSGIIEPKIK